MNTIIFVADFDVDSVEPEEIPAGCSLRDSGIRTAMLSADGGILVHIALEIAAGTSSAVVAHFIIQAIKKRSYKTRQTITIDSKRISFEHGAITEYIETKTVAQQDKSDD